MMLLELQQEWQDMFGYGDATDANDNAVNRFKRQANTVYRELMGQKGFSVLRRMTLPFDSISGVKSAVLPLAASRIITIHDRTNNIPLDPMDLQELRGDDPAQVMTSSAPYAYVKENLAAATARDPADASTLVMKSTSANDTSGLQVYIQGIITGGYPKPANNALNGTTSVDIDPTTTTWRFVRKFFLSGIARGDVILYEDSTAGTELARIPAGRRSTRYSRILLHPTPSAPVTYYADVELMLEDLIVDADEPILPDDYHWLLSSGAMMREFLKRKQAAEYGAERARFISGYRDLKLWLQRPEGVASHMRRRFSQLGAYFPPGS